MSSILDVVATAVTGMAIGFGLAAIGVWPLTRALQAARYAATHDETTGLPNRRALCPKLSRATRRGRVAVALLDLNGFKAINDTHGHRAGDLVLAEVAARLAALPEPSFVARLSGDEFVLLIDDRADAAMDTAHAARARIAAAPVLLPDGARVKVTASVGVAASRLGVTPRALLHEADLAMYTAKHIRAGVYKYPARAAGPSRDVTDRPRVRARDRHRPMAVRR